METTHVHALDYLSVVRRRKWWLVSPLAASLLIGLLLVRFLPKEYTSTATLGVVAPIVSPNLIDQSRSLDNQERLRAMSQQLTSVSILSRVVREEGLGSTAAGDPQIGRLRGAISVSVPDPVAITNEPRRFDTFFVSYADNDPARAQRIANRLAVVFVDETSKARTERAEDTSAFISMQLRASQERLGELERRLRSSKEAYMGRLPEQTQANLQTLSGLRMQLQTNAVTLASEQDRLSVIDRQLEAVKRGSDDVLIVPRAGDAGRQAPETRVVALQRDLAAARSMYTDRHPEVQRLQDELAAARRDASSGRDQPNAERLAELQFDPVYRQLLAEREMTALRVRELQRSTNEAQRQINTYQARVDAAPMVEQRLADVQRDYDLAKQQYTDLSSKLHLATIAESVERNRGGEQFTILYPASFPTEPTRPIPLRVMLVSILAGICLGGALALGREYLDRTVHDARELKNEFDVPILGEVSRIEPA